MQYVSPALPKAPVLRVTPGQLVISGFPSKLTKLLLLTDLRAESRPAVEFAIELTKLFTARLTLMHGEPLQSGLFLAKICQPRPTPIRQDRRCFA